MVSIKLEKRLVLALVIYVVSLLAANTLGLKIMPFIFGTHLSVSIFFFPFVFLMTDVIGQVYGRETAKLFVWAGFMSILVFMAFSALSLALPWSTAADWVREGYGSVFGISLRLSIASLAAFLIAEYQDVLSFFYFQNRLGVQAFWLRSTLSNLWSQLLDTAVFMFIAFLGVYPIKTIILMGLPWWLYKVLAGLAYTPLSYAGIRVLSYKKYDHESQSN